MKGETRKVQFTGNSSYIVSLPKPWAEEMGIKSGDQVVITRHGATSMRVSLPHERAVGAAGAGAAEATVGVEGDSSPDSLVRKVISLYLRGHTIIHVVRGKDPFGATQRNAVKDAVRRRLVGAEIISDSSAGITIQVLVNTVALSVDGAFKRMLHLSRSMLADAVAAVSGHDVDLAREVIGADDEVDRFGFYITRQLKLAVDDEGVLGDLGLGNAPNCLDYRLVVKSVERSGDHAVAIARDPLEFRSAIGPHLSSRLGEMAAHASSALDSACTALFTGNYAMAERTVNDTGIKSLEGGVLEATRRGRSEEGYRARRIAEDIRRISEYATDIAETVLNMNIDKATSRGSRGEP